MTRQVFRFSMALSVVAFMTCTNSARAQKDSISPQNWGGQPSWPQQPSSNWSGQQNQDSVQQPGPAGTAPGWSARPGTSGWVQRPGPAGAVPGWAQPGPPQGMRPGTTWSQQAGSNWAQQQSQNWAEQQARNAEMTRQALQSQANQAPRPQVVQYERWKQEWVQQHPGEPVPNLGELEKLHHDEIMSNIQRDGAAMWARRRQEVQAKYQMARQVQERRNAAQHVSWTKQQWDRWDKQYDQDQQQQARDYVNAFGKMGEDARIEQANREHRQSLGLDY